MSDSPETLPCSVDRELLANSFAGLAKHVLYTERQIQEIRREIQDMKREMKAGFDRIDSRLDNMNTRLHNAEAREKNEDAFKSRGDYVPLLKADGTAIANFPTNWEAVQDLDDQTIDALLTDLDVDFKGLDLYNKMHRFLREIGVKSIPTAIM
ncbi:unnamed protein product [Fusarium langsethiae]|nr:unnamed protein product [Fusarium langsethiae]